MKKLIKTYSTAPNIRNLTWEEKLLYMMVNQSLEDYFTTKPPLIHAEYDLYWLFNVYYRNKKDIIKNREGAIAFFNDPNSLFNKYANLDKEYLIKTYERKVKSKSRF